jgi:hypothetical protein
MSTEEFLDAQEIKGKSVRDVSTKTREDRLAGYRGKPGNTVWKQDSESKVESYLKMYTPEYVVYEFNLSTGVKDHAGIDSYDATAWFYKNELINISLNLSTISPFRDILTQKYGNPRTRDNMKKEICQNAYGAKFEHDSGDISWIWGGVGPVIGSLTFSVGECGKKVSSKYKILNSGKIITVIELESKARQDAVNEEKKSKASSSKL